MGGMCVLMQKELHNALLESEKRPELMVQCTLRKLTRAKLMNSALLEGEQRQK